MTLHDVRQRLSDIQTDRQICRDVIPSARLTSCGQTASIASHRTTSDREGPATDGRDGGGRSTRRIVRKLSQLVTPDWLLSRQVAVASSMLCTAAFVSRRSTNSIDVQPQCHGSSRFSLSRHLTGDPSSASHPPTNSLPVTYCNHVSTSQWFNYSSALHRARLVPG